jgi:hypothetical protein
MNNIEMQEFFNSIYYGADIDFKYKDFFYHINAGYDSDQVHNISVYKYDKHPDSHESSTIYEKLYEYKSNSASDNVEQFLNEPIFNNQSIYSISSEIELLYC